MTDEWTQLLTLMPADLEASATRNGAIERRRQVRDAATLLRLALVYGFCDQSLRATAAWASQQGVADLSDVALLKRLKKSANWLAELLTQKLTDRAVLLRETARRSVRVRLLDATVVSRPGSQGTDWRIHMSFDLGRLSIDHVTLSGPETAESIRHYALAADEIAVADRGYARRREIALVSAAHAGLVVRLNWQNVPLQDLTGQPIDLLAQLRAIAADEVLDLAVSTQPDAQHGLPAVPGRLIAVRRSAAATEATRKRILTRAHKKGKTPDPRTLESAAYVFLFTTLSAEDWPPGDILELYRFRWQVELAFKRMKSILALDELRAKDEQLCRTYLLAKLLATLLVEDLLHQAGAAFSPWGYGLPAPLVPVAALASG